MGRRVPVPAADGGPRDSLLRCRSHGRPGGSRPHTRDPRPPDRRRRHDARGRAAQLHDPGGRRPARVGRPTPRRRPGQPDAAHHAAAASGPPRRRPPSADLPGRSRRDPGPHRGPQDRPAGHQAAAPATSTRCATSRCTSTASARPARPGQGDLPVRPRPRRGCSCRSSTRRRSRTARGCWGWSSRSTRATTSASCTRSPRSAATSSTSTTPLTATSEELWLQTSEGPKGTPGKTQVIAAFLSQEAADPAEAHPTPKPVVCG